MAKVDPASRMMPRIGLPASVILAGIALAALPISYEGLIRIFGPPVVYTLIESTKTLILAWVVTVVGGTLMAGAMVLGHRLCKRCPGYVWAWGAVLLFALAMSFI